MANSTWKDAQHHILLENCKLKQQWNTITSLSGISKIMTTQNADEEMDQQKISIIVSGDAKLSSLFGRQCGVFLQN